MLTIFFQSEHTILWKDLSVDRSDPSCVLGEGGFGVVRRGEWVRTPVAIKELHLKSAAISEEAKAEFEKESTLHAKLRFTHIVQFFGVCLDGPAPMMVMEIMHRSLTSLLRNKSEELIWSEKLRLGLEITNGLEYLHSHKLIHRDLKSMNVLLSETSKHD